MKKPAAILLVISLLLGLTACAGPESNPSGGDPTSQTELSVTDPQSQTEPSAAGTRPQTEPSATEPASHSETAGPTDPAEDLSGRYGGHLNVRICVKPSTPDPRKRLTTWLYMYLTLCFENPLTVDADGDPQPAVCDYDFSPDGKTLKLWVRDGARFSNGDPVDIYDVQASFHRFLSQHSTGKAHAENIESETVDAAGKVLTIVYRTYQENIMYYFASYKPWMAVMPREICEEFMNEEIPADRWEDCIGTGPYRYAAFAADESVTVERVPGYEPRMEDAARTGFAGIKYAYLDSLTFIYDGNDAAAGQALLDGRYDVVEVLPAEYRSRLEEFGLKKTVLPSDTGLAIRFNVDGSVDAEGSPINVTAKYPSLRKAIMAAIDYEAFLNVAADGQQNMSGAAAGPFLNPRYRTDAWVNADWYGAADLSVVSKYLEAAKEEGWDGTEAVQLVPSSNQSLIIRLELAKYLEAAGIPHMVWTMEAASSFTTWGQGNNYDIGFFWPSCMVTPTKTTLFTTWWKNDEVQSGYLTRMGELQPDSDGYVQLAREYEEYLVDQCGTAFMGRLDWYWYAPETLVIEDEGPVRYFFNTWWEDPENHPAP